MQELSIHETERGKILLLILPIASLYSPTKTQTGCTPNLWGMWRIITLEYRGLYGNHKPGYDLAL